MARKILLADDSVTAQNMGRKILADAGYDVVTVNNGSAALKRITETKPDLIVLDVYMPGYSGLEVCQRIKDAAETEHIPVLLTVGKLEPFKPEEARRVRADGHIVKPFEASELLTAITRLEDRMVPQQSDGRFGSVSGVERFGGDSGGRKTENNGDADTGWKSRLRFPSKKKKDEPEPEIPETEDVAGTAPFRDFRKAKGKAAANAPFAVKAPPPPGQEPGLVPDIPRDITPDELDALSALAAKLDGPIPAVENIAPIAEAAPAAPAQPDQANSNVAPVEAVSTEISAAEVPKTYAEIVAAAKAKKENENKVVVEPAATAVESAAASVEASPAAIAVGAAVGAGLGAEPGTTSEFEIPVRPKELAVETGAAGAPPVAIEAPQQEAAATTVPQPQTQGHAIQPAESAVGATVNTASRAEEPAQVDRSDEPTFTKASNAIEQTKPEADRAEEKVEQKALEAVAQDNTKPSVAEAAVVAKFEERPVEPSQEQQLQSLQSKAEELAASGAQTEKSATGELKEETTQSVPVAPATQDVPASSELSPSDAELAHALRLLTPAGGNSDSAIIPSHGTLIAAGQLLAEEALRNAASGPRWIAQPVALSPEETSLSLEAEMFRAYMTIPPVALATLEPSKMTGVSAIEAAVENRLAAAELATKASSDQALAQAATVRPSESAGAEAPGEVSKPISTEASQQAQASELEKVKTETIEATTEAETIEAAKPEVATKDSPASSTEGAQATAIASSQEAVEAREQSATMAAEPTVVSEADENQDSSSEVGSEESMAKDNTSKSGKSNWRQIRTAPAGAAADGNLLEAAKQAEGMAAEPAKAMAAVAAEGASSATPDAGTIASIVDSVMADLRPKIVEEIAKKLAGK
ncbi:MAG TPA: response regulator [Terriglobales bacterium]|nr:response regulator [Terriglobales bacterium]